MTQQPTAESTTSVTTEPSQKSKGLISKLLWALIIPASIPFKFNLLKKTEHKIYVSLVILALGFVINMINIGLFTDDKKVTKVNYQLLPLLDNEQFVIRQKTNWDYYLEEQKNTNRLVSYFDGVALFISPLWVGYHSSDRFFDESIKHGKVRNRYHFETEFSLKGAGYQKNGKSTEPSCSLRIDDARRGLNDASKLFNIDKYQLATDNDFCEHAWGEKANGMNTDSMGFIKQRLAEQITKAKNTKVYQQAKHKQTSIFARE